MFVVCKPLVLLDSARSFNYTRTNKTRWKTLIFEVFRRVCYYGKYYLNPSVRSNGGATEKFLHRFKVLQTGLGSFFCPHIVTNRNERESGRAGIDPHAGGGEKKRCRSLGRTYRASWIDRGLIFLFLKFF